MNIFNKETIKNYWSGNYVTSSPDLIAVKYGIKKVTRIECNGLLEFEKIKNEFKRHHLDVIKSDEELFGKYNLYISLDKKLAIQAKNIDPSYKIIKHGELFNEVEADVMKFSQLINYPDCCIKEYFKNIKKNTTLDQIKTFQRLPKKISFVYNNVLNGASNIYLSFHLPCSFSCQKTFVYQKKIFEKIKLASSKFAEVITSHLKNPFLVFLNPMLGSAYVSWDNRSGIIFDGRIEKELLNYDRFIFFKTNYPDYQNNNNKIDLDVVIEKLYLGNKIIFDHVGFTIYYGKKKIYRFNNKDNLRAFFLNFV